MNTQLYLISPPKIELDVFAKQLELALRINKDTQGEVSRPSEPSASPHGRGAAEPGGIKNFVGAFQLRLKNANDDEIKQAIDRLMPICHAHEVAFIINDRVDLCIEHGCDGVHVGQEDLLNVPGLDSCLAHAEGAKLTKELKAGESTDSLLVPSEGTHGEVSRPSESSTCEASPHGRAVGETGGKIKALRAQLTEDMVLGITCHASKHLAMEAAEAGANYVAFGAFYPTTSKPKEKLEKWGTPSPDILEWWTTWTEIPCVAIGGITPENCGPLIEAGTDFIAVITAVWEHKGGPEVAMAEFWEMVS